jgi:hypothetical protein
LILHSFLCHLLVTFKSVDRYFFAISGFVFVAATTLPLPLAVVLTPSFPDHAILFISKSFVSSVISLGPSNCDSPSRKGHPLSCSMLCFMALSLDSSKQAT